MHGLRLGNDLEQVLGRNERAASDAGTAVFDRLVRAAAMKALRFFAKFAGCTTIASGADPTMAAGVISSVR